MLDDKKGGQDEKFVGWNISQTSQIPNQTINFLYTTGGFMSMRANSFDGVAEFKSFNFSL